MARAEGSPKTGGRKLGTPNKKTLVLQQAFHHYGIDLISEIAALLPTLESDKRADVLLHLMGYLYPRRKPVEGFMELTGPEAIVSVQDDNEG